MNPEKASKQFEIHLRLGLRTGSKPEARSKFLVRQDLALSGYKAQNGFPDGRYRSPQKDLFVRPPL